jgi:hypothetical protein
MTSKFQDKIFDWMQSDTAVKIILLFAMLACLYTIYEAGEYSQAQNEYWMEQMEKCDCPWNETIEPYEGNFSILGTEFKVTPDDNKDND